MSASMPKQMFNTGRAVAKAWLKADGAKLTSAAVCRALRLADMVLKYESAPDFASLLSAWEYGFDSTLHAAGVAAAARAPDDLSACAPAVLAEPAPATSLLEERFEHFPDELLEAHADAAPLMRELNKVATICAGLGVVLRIVAGNVVVQDNFNPDDPGATPPLSQGAVCNLAAMAAAMCEQLNDNVAERADWFKSKVPA